MASAATYRVSLEHGTSRTIAAVHARVSAREVPVVFRHFLDQVYAAGRAADVQLDGQCV